MKRIVITGASSGLGMGVARAFAIKGWRVGIAARREEPLIAMKQEFGDLIEYESIDISLPEAPDKLLNLIDRLGGMDIYLQAAGIGKQNLDLNMEIERHTIMTNCVGFTAMVDTAFNYFLTLPNIDNKQIVIISSVAGTNGLGSAPSYSASKRFESIYLTALEQLARIKGLKPHQLRFTDVRPGFISTDLLDTSTRYPMLMTPQYAIPRIVKAITRHRRVAYIDWRWGLLVKLWKFIPDFLWVRIKATTSKKNNN